MKPISPFEAKHGREFYVNGPFGSEKRLGSAKEKLGELIDSSWKHSWH